MRVLTVVAHQSADGHVHQPGDGYALEGIELELRVKDGIVRPADAAPVPEPAIADVVAAARAHVAEMVAPDPAE